MATYEQRYPGEDIPYDITFDRDVDDATNIIAVVYTIDKHNNIAELAKYSKETQEGFKTLVLQADNKTIRLIIDYATSKDVADKLVYADGYILDEAPELEGGVQRTYFKDTFGFRIETTGTKQYLV